MAPESPCPPVAAVDSRAGYQYNGRMRILSLSGWFLGLLLFFTLGVGSVQDMQAGQSPASPPRPRLQDSREAPAAARLLEQVALRYDPEMTQEARDRDFLEKIALAKKLLSVPNLVDLRQQSLTLLNGRGEVSWETLRCLKWPGGDRVGVTLSIPVWVPAQAKRVPAFAGFEKQWQTVALCQPRPACYVWFDGKLSDINNKPRYRAERTLVEMNSRFAPFAGLLLEYIFREGWYDANKRVPLLVVRCGEDTWSVPASLGPVVAECLSYPDKTGASLDACVVQGYYESLAELHHGRHVPVSNHRLGLAMDINDFNFKNVVDGTPNPVSMSLRQYNRDALHKLDARNLPAWVYTAAKWVGLRIPQEWLYTGTNADWPHFDVGTKNLSAGVEH